MTMLLDRLANVAWELGMVSGSTRTTFALDSAYVFGSSGKAHGVRFFSPVTDAAANLDVFFHVSTAPGTSVNLTVELRNHVTAASPGLPGTLISSNTGVASGTTSTKWIKVTFTGVSLTIGTPYWIVIADPVAVTNLVTILSGGAGPAAVATEPFKGYTSTTGFSAVGTAVNQPPAMVLKFSGSNPDAYRGSPITQLYTSGANSPNNTLRKGIKILGLTEAIKISGVNLPLNVTTVTGVEIYEGAALPGGTKLLDLTVSLLHTSCQYVNFAPITLQKGTVYRIVWKYGSTGAASVYMVDDSATYGADLLQCMPMGGQCHYCTEDGAGGWLDKTDSMTPLMAVVNDQVAVAAGGGAPLGTIWRPDQGGGTPMY